MNSGPQKQPFRASTGTSNLQHHIESILGSEGGYSSATGPWRDRVRPLRDGRHWEKGLNNRRDDGRKPRKTYGGSRTSPYIPPHDAQFDNANHPSWRRWKDCLTCRNRGAKCDGLQPTCGPCEQIYEKNPCEYAYAAGSSKENPIFRSKGRYPVSGNPPALTNDYDTANYGQGSLTYNGSHVHNDRHHDQSSTAVVHVHVHESGSTLSSSRSPTSMSSSMPVTPPGTSQGTIPITSPHDSASERECTRSEQYGLLLLGCGIGYPLWKPTPRCTREAEYIVSIGDVGIISDGLPFNTLFNITQPIHSLANKDGVPEGVHPPCFIDPRWVTVDDKYHPKGTTLIRPKNAVSCQAIQGFDGSSVYSYTLTDTHGALLSLPGGGVLENLERKGEFRQRIKKHWHQWYDFSEKQGYLEEHQALYIVTGVERCSSWAIAAWDYAPTDCTDSGTLKLSVNESAGKCSWTHSIARCETQSFGTPSGTEGASALKQTVFVRGFWINKFHGEMDNSMLQTKPLSMRLGGRDKGLDGGTYFWGNGGSAIGPSSGPSSMSTFNSGSGPANGGYFDVLAHTEAADHLQEPQVYRFSVDNLDFLFSAVASPCELINRFAFIVLSRINPLVSNTGCVVFSHDDDWINIVQEYDDGFPTKMEFFRNISCKFKFIVEGDAIYSAKLTDHDAKTIQSQTAGGVISVLVQFREPDPLLDEDSGQSAAMAWDLASAPALLDHDTKDETESFRSEEFPSQIDCCAEEARERTTESSSSTLYRQVMRIDDQAEPSTITYTTSYSTPTTDITSPMKSDKFEAKPRPAWQRTYTEPLKETMTKGSRWDGRWPWSRWTGLLNYEISDSSCMPDGELDDPNSLSNLPETQRNPLDFVTRENTQSSTG